MESYNNSIWVSIMTEERHKKKERERELTFSHGFDEQFASDQLQNRFFQTM